MADRVGVDAEVASAAGQPPRAQRQDLRLGLGARRLPGGGGDFRVYAAPIGPPFCLVWDA